MPISHNYLPDRTFRSLVCLEQQNVPNLSDNGGPRPFCVAIRKITANNNLHERCCIRRLPARCLLGVQMALLCGPQEHTGDKLIDHYSQNTRIKGIVVVLNGQLEPRLLRAASACSLSVLRAPGAEQAFRALIHLRPDAIVVQVAEMWNEPLRLIRLVAGSPLQVPVIAVATSHDDDTERAIRAAGATCYLPGGECHLLRRALESLVV